MYDLIAFAIFFNSHNMITETKTIKSIFMLNSFPKEFNLLREFLTQWVIFCEKEWMLLAALFELQTISRNNFLFKFDEEDKYFLYFSISGCAKTYFLKEGKEHTIRMIQPNQLFSSKLSCFNQNSTELYIKAVENMVVLSISYEDLYYFFNKSKAGEKLGRFINDYLYQEAILREWMLNSLDAQERYDFLFEHHTDYFNLFSLKVIASYLNITPETLSRVRNNLRSKK